MVEDRTAHDRQRRVAADKVVRQCVREVEQFIRRPFPHVHGDVLLVDDDAVLVVIGIRRILHEPFFAADVHLHRADVPPRRVRRRTLEPLVLLAKRARGVLFPLRRGEKFGDVLVVLFRLGEVDGDLQHVVPVRIFPFQIAGDCRLLHIPVLYGYIVQIVARRLRAPFRLDFAESTVDLRGEGRKHSEHVRDVPLDKVLRAQPLFQRERLQFLRERVRHVGGQLRGNIRIPLIRFGKAELRQQHVAHVHLVLFPQAQVRLCIGKQFFDQQFAVHFSLPRPQAL